MRLPRPAAFAAALAAALTAAAPAAAQSVSVALDHVERVHLRGAAADVVIGNPAVADVSLIDPRTLVVTGKGPGTTSLVVFDRARRVIFEGPISVGVRGGQVAMVRGTEGGAAEEKLFTCAGVCTPQRAR